VRAGRANLNRFPVAASLLIAAALAAAGLGVHILVTERGAANDIKGFVLLLLGAVLLVGGLVLWELRAIRNKQP
jgi:hypothetical protein